jgi:hypothetical protein
MIVCFTLKKGVHFPPKCWYVSNELHVVTPRKPVTFIPVSAIILKLTPFQVVRYVSCNKPVGAVALHENVSHITITLMNMVMVFIRWSFVVTRCSLVGVYNNVCSSETSVATYEIMWYDSPEDHYVNFHFCEDFRSCIMPIYDVRNLKPLLHLVYSSACDKCCNIVL